VLLGNVVKWPGKRGTLVHVIMSTCCELWTLHGDNTTRFMAVEWMHNAVNACLVPSWTGQ